MSVREIMDRNDGASGLSSVAVVVITAQRDISVTIVEQFDFFPLPHWSNHASQAIVQLQTANNANCAGKNDLKTIAQTFV